MTIEPEGLAEPSADRRTTLRDPDIKGKRQKRQQKQRAADPAGGIRSPAASPRNPLGRLAVIKLGVYRVGTLALAIVALIRGLELLAQRASRRRRPCRESPGATERGSEA